MNRIQRLLTLVLLLVLLAGCTPAAPTPWSASPSPYVEIAKPTPTPLSASPSPDVEIAKSTRTPRPPPGAPQGTTDTHEILYLTTWDLGSALYAYNLESQSSELLLESGYEQHPVLSPDGAKILIDLPLGAQRTRVVYDLQNHTYAALPSGNIYAWSWDGTYAVIGDARAALVDMRDGREIVPLQDIWGTDYTLTPDDRLLYSTLDPLKIMAVGLKRDAQGEVTGLESQAVELATPILGMRTVIPELQISPDGKWIAFVGETPLPNTNPTGDDADIYILGIDGKNLINLTKGEYTRDQRRLCSGPVWSPDSSRVTFITCEIGSDGFTLSSHLVHTATADGTAIEEDSDRRNFADLRENVSWSSDSQSVSFVSGNGLIVISNNNGYKLIDLGSTTVYYAAFRPPLAKQAQPVNCARTFTHLKVGVQAVVAPGDANRVRSEPAKGNNEVAMIPAGTQMKILEGPVCANGLVFWKIDSEKIPGGSAWTAEGDFNEHWLEPIK